MNWLKLALFSSIGRKALMAVTGLSFCAFLVVHFVGNFFLYVGRDSFNSYVEHLHALGFLVNIAEMGLLFFAAVHILAAVTLYIENLMARPVRYAYRRDAGGRTLASRLMPYTGLYILLFVLFHLITFKYADHTGTTVYDLVNQAFASFGYIVFYIFSMAVVAFHISHGFWSAFQTLGLNHPKYMPAIHIISLALAVVIGVGFGLIPIYMLIV